MSYVIHEGKRYIEAWMRSVPGNDDFCMFVNEQPEGGFEFSFLDYKPEDESKYKKVYVLVEHPVQLPDDLHVESMKLENGSLDIVLKPGTQAVQYIAAHLMMCLQENSAPNYVEMDVLHEPTNESFTILVQRKTGLTPADKLAKAEEKIKKLKFERDAYKAAAESWMKDRDALIEKYEPLTLILSEKKDT